MNARPKLITALSLFFGAGALISLTSAIALLIPESFLQSMWRLNPRALQAFNTMGPWAIVLLLTVSFACGFAAFGLWCGKLWGYRVAKGLLVINLIGDIYNVVSGTEPRAAIGVPIVALIFFFITRPRTKAYFYK